MKTKRGLVPDDCLHLLHCLATGKCSQPQTYHTLSIDTGIPEKSLWRIINEYKNMLRAVAEKNNYRFRIINSEDIIIDAVYDGPGN